MPLKMTPLPNETMEKVAADFYGWRVPASSYLQVLKISIHRSGEFYVSKGGHTQV
jgi:hypothetical protein